MTLQEPPATMMVRNINSQWVNVLAASIQKTPIPHSVILPCLLLNDMEVNAFDDKKLAEYQICTLGGNHLRTACQQLLQSQDTSHLDRVRFIDIDLYLGLNTNQARRLANLHNIQSESSQVSFAFILIKPIIND